jgi:hypothetical protein
MTAFLREGNKMKPKRWGKRGSWYVVAFVLPMMIMMVSPALSATGWYNWYNSANTTMYWMYDGNWRLAYTYGAGQWWDCTQLGGHDNWNKLGSTGVSDTFLGNAALGAYYPLNNGWMYGYSTANDLGYWYHMDGLSFRFAYHYGSGRWFDYGKDGNWQVLSAGGLSSAFLGDGKWHDLANNWQFLCGGGDFGVWKNPTLDLQQYAYSFVTGQWFDSGKDGSWAALGTSGMSSAFFGDGTWHDIGNHWQYLCGGGNFGVWKNLTLDLQQFAYDYGTGQWYHEDRSKKGWAGLGTSGLSVAFLGDGSWHGLGDNWQYIYGGGGDFGFWKNSSLDIPQFAYDYSHVQWYHQGIGGWASIGSYYWRWGVSTGFLGDGNWHLVGRDGYLVTEPIPGGGMWYYEVERGPVYYKYDIASGLGQWWRPIDDAIFAYDYVKGQWYTQGKYGGTATLGPAGLSPSVMGDRYDDPLGPSIGDGHWVYSYDLGWAWLTNMVSGVYYRYCYDTGQWWKSDPRNDSYNVKVGAPGASPDFSWLF